MRKISWVLLLPFFLLFAQQGELRHEYGHLGTQQPAGAQKKKAPDGDPCAVCLAYAQLSGAAQADVAAPVLLAHLAFHHAPALVVASADTETASPRSRGPPSP